MQLLTSLPINSWYKLKHTARLNVKTGGINQKEIQSAKILSF